MWDRIARVSFPTDINSVPLQVLTLAEAKAQCRVDYPDDDDFISALIDSATAFIEGPSGIGISLLNSQWRMSLDRFPDGDIRVLLGPVVSIDSITYTDLSGTVQTLDPSLYVIDYDRKPCTIARRFSATWPVVYQSIGVVKVNFTAGYGASKANIPADLRQAAKLLVGFWYEARQAVLGTDARITPVDPPYAVKAVLDRYRRVPFG